MEPTFRLAWLGEEEEAEEGDEEVDMEASKEVCIHTGLNKKNNKTVTSQQLKDIPPEHTMFLYVHSLFSYIR